MTVVHPPGIRVSLSDVRKQYGTLRALDDVTLEIKPGEFFSLLGPSGCGKTTLLRALAGLVQPDAGVVRFGDEVVVDCNARRFVAVERRNLGMVFQDYALWPHLRVRENVAFPLEARKRPAEQHAARIDAALQRVELAALRERFPGELSGGQQQRVALARAIVDQPPLLLFDEPLSNLDASLRDALGREMRRLARSIGATAVYVTHDQAEALSLSDRIAVMRNGRIVQVATPESLMHDPCNPWVAEFMKAGSLVEGVVRENHFAPASGATAREPGTASRPTQSPAPSASLNLAELDSGLTGSRHADGIATLLIPGSALRIDAAGPIAARIEQVQFRGDRFEVSASWCRDDAAAHRSQAGEQAPDSPAMLQFWHATALVPGELVRLAVDGKHLRLFRSHEAVATGLSA